MFFFSREYAVISSTVMSSECNSTGIVKCAMSCTSCDIFCTLLGKKKERTGNRTVKTVLQFCSFGTVSVTRSSPAAGRLRDTLSDKNLSVAVGHAK